jgi:hypothetical protein
VKLIYKDSDKLVFHLAKREKATLEEVLSHYPALSPTFHLPPDQDGTKRENQIDRELLEHSLAEEKKEHRLRLEAFLADPSRWGAHKKTWQLCLPSDDVEWFLQVINDVRVGKWYLAGCPDGPDDIPPEITMEKLQHMWCMELAGAFQAMLLEALDTPS